MSGLTIGVAFDQSLLMDYYHNSIRSGMCQLIGTLKKQEPNARLHPSYFNHDYHVMSNDSLEQFDVTIQANPYSAEGGTALFDAIGKLISDLKEANSRLQESEKSSHVAIVVLTDGVDHSSTNQTAYSVNQMVQQAKKQGWLCLFFSSHPDAETAAEQCGFDPSCSAYVDPNKSWKALIAASMCVEKYRKDGWTGFSEKERSELSRAERWSLNTPRTPHLH